MTTKICSKCEIKKPLTEFHECKSNPDGLQYMCKECIKAYAYGYRQSHKEENAERGRKYYQDHKEEIVEYRQTHKEEITKCRREHRQSHKEEIAKYQKKYRQTEEYKKSSQKSGHKRRALKFNATIEDFYSVEVFERDNYICQICGIKTRPDFKNSFHSKYPNLDHIVPLSRGGAHSKQNVQCLCRKWRYELF